MKKNQTSLPFLVLVIIFSFMGMGGCQLLSQPQSPKNVSQTPQDRRIGIIKSLGGVATANQGTDLLMMDDGATILLKSSTINLSDSKYSSKRVEVSGVMALTADGKQIIEVQSIDILDPLAPVSQAQTQMPQWQDYVNTGLGFRVRYRDDFKVEDNNDSISFTRPVALTDVVLATSQEKSSSTLEVATSHIITVTAQTHSSDQTLLKDFLNLKNDDPSTLAAAGYSKSMIGTDNVVSYKALDPKTPNFVSFSFGDDFHFYRISYHGGVGSAQSIDDQNVFYDFLSSFQLLNRPKVSSSQEATQQLIKPVKSTVPEKSLTQAVAPAPSENVEKGATQATSPSVSNSAPSSVTPTASISGGTQELLPGYNSLTSAGYKFTMQYPKQWYYGQTTVSDAEVVRRYDFGTKPVDEQPGIINFDIISKGVPAGNTLTLGNKTIISTNNGVTASYYYKSPKRVYRLTGPAGSSATLESMIATFQEQ